MRTCPKCNKTYTGYPAISRLDNITPICPTCGSREALSSLGLDETEIKKIIKEIKNYEELYKKTI